MKTGIEMNKAELDIRSECVRKCTYHNVNSTEPEGVPCCDVKCDEFEGDLKDE